ncbi:MAG: YkgJ family cysteine cluster protein [Pseudomonadota bacterium]
MEVRVELSAPASGGRESVCTCGASRVLKLTPARHDDAEFFGCGRHAVRLLCTDATQELAMNEILRLKSHDIFPFECHGELECFTRCCRDINLFLTPYDVLRLKNCLSLNSREFLNRYTVSMYIEEVGHPLVAMKMTGDDKTCPFAGKDGCGVYPDRPWSCRTFPLEPCTSKDSHPSPDTTSTEKTFAVVRRPFCRGFNDGGTVSVGNWLRDQGTEIYEEMNSIWSEITLNKRFPARGLDNTGIQMFFIASYSLDEFRELALRPSFLSTYTVSREEIEPFMKDDILLFKFACRWLRVALFKEEIPLP